MSWWNSFVHLLEILYLKQNEYTGKICMSEIFLPALSIKGLLCKEEFAPQKANSFLFKESSCQERLVYGIVNTEQVSKVVYHVKMVEDRSVN